MVAIVSGNSLGLSLSSLAVLGQRGVQGTAAHGSSGEGVFVNVANGNLVLQTQDDLLVGRGPDAAALRTYNSQGLLNDDNGDNWSSGFWLKPLALAGVLNGAGSTLQRTDRDGAVATYTYDSALGHYRSSADEGAHDTIRLVAADGQLEWREGSSGLLQRYEMGGAFRVLSTRDASGNALTYGYDGSGRVVSVVSGSGETTFYDFTGGNLTQVRTMDAASNVSTRVRYGYDASNRLSTVTVDLSPADNSIVDGKVLRTTYSYDGSSKRVIGIAQSDGSSITIGYALDVATGSYRVASVTNALNQSVSIAYTAEAGAAGTAVVRGALGIATTYDFDASGRTTRITPPTIDNIAAVRTYEYNAEGDLVFMRDGAGQPTVFQYDANGNQMLERNHAGDTVRRTFDAGNRLLNETRYLKPDPDGDGPGEASAPATYRNVYEATSARGLLRFEVSAEGRVTEHRYDGFGQRITTLIYTAASYPVSALATDATLTEANVTAWASWQPASAVQRADMVYDSRGLLQSRTTYAKVDAAGQGVVDGTHSRETFVHDRAGLLLQRVSASGGAVTYTYDGVGRELVRVNEVGQVTLTAYADASARKVRTDPNGLVTTTLFDSAGRMTSTVTSGPGAVALGETKYFHDAAGRLRMSQDSTGVRSWTLYDDANRKTADVDGNGTLIEYSYNGNDNVVVTVTYATAVNTALLVDAGGAPVLATVAGIRPVAAAGDVKEWRCYDNAQRVVRTARTIGTGTTAAATWTFFDSASRPTATVAYATPVDAARMWPGWVAVPAASAQDRWTRNYFDADGLLLGTLDAEGYLMRFNYDAAGRLVERTGYATATDVALRQTGTLAQLTPPAAPGDARSVLLYDAQGRVMAELDAESYLTESVYDQAGALTRSIRYANKVTATVATTSTLATIRPLSTVADRVSSRAYDALGRLAQETSPEGVVTQYSYDTAGNLVSTVRAAGSTEVRTLLARFDARGLLTGELSAEGAALLTGGQTQAQVDAIWQQHGNTHAYDLAGRRISTTDALGKRSFFYYNADGQQTHAVNGMGEVKENRYDVLGRLVEQVAYAGRLNTTTYVGGLSNSWLLADVSAIANASVDSRESFTYTNAGQVASRTDALGNVNGTTYNTFGDAINRTTATGGDNLVETLSVDRRGQSTTTLSDGHVMTTAVYDAFGRMTRSVDGNGNVRERAYDRLGRIVTQREPTGVLAGTGTASTVGMSERNTTYDAFGRVLTQVDALGAKTEYIYDTVARAMLVTTPEGIRTTTTYTRHGQVESVRLQERTIAGVPDSPGQSTNYSYDRNGNVLRTNAPLGVTTRATYDAANRLIETTDANGIKVAYTYDAAHRVLTRRLDPLGLNIVTTYQYDGKGQKVAVTDANGVVTTVAYDRKGQVLKETVDPTGLNLQTTYTYDARGNTLSVTAPGGLLTQYTFDVLGRRVKEQVDPTRLNLTRSWTYDVNGNVQSSTDPLGNVTRHVYSASDRLVYTVDPLGGVRQNDYDLEGRVIRTVAYAAFITAPAPTATLTRAAVTALLVAAPAQDVVEHRVYRKDGKLTATVGGVGGVVKYVYDGVGRVKTRTAYVTTVGAGWVPGTEPVVASESNDEVVHSVYDALDRVIYTVDGNRSVVSIKYDANGNVQERVTYAKTLPAGVAITKAGIEDAVPGIANAARDAVTTNTHDAAGRLTWTRNGTGAVTQRVYDGNGNVVQVIEYVRPVLGTTLSNVVIDDRDRKKSMAYDAANRLVFEVDPLNGVTEHAYHSIGKPIRRTMYAKEIAAVPALGTAATVGAIRLALRPDAAADRTYLYAYDSTGRSIAVFDPFGIGTETQYDAAGNAVATVRYASPIAYPLEIAMRSFQMAKIMLLNAANASIDRATWRTFDAAGRQVHEVSPEGAVKKMEYDGAGRLVRSTRYASAITTLPVTKNVATIAAAVASQNQVPTEAFSYDSAGRMLRSTDVLGYKEEFTYDGAGRKLTFTDKAESIWNYAHDARGRVIEEKSPVVSLISGLVDATGNLADRTAAQAGVTTAFSYDALGLLDTRTEAVGRPEERITRYEYDQMGRQTRVVHASVGVYIPEEAAVTANGATSVASRVEATRSPETRTYYDALGNAVANIDVDVANGNALTQKFYDRSGRLAYDVNALGYVTGYTRNAFGEVTTLVRYGRPTNLATAVITAASQLPSKAQVDSLLAGPDPYPYSSPNRTHQTRYDRAGRVTETVDPVGYVSELNDAGARVAGIVGKTTRTTYNAFGDVIQERSLRNAADSWSIATHYYDRAGRRTDTIDALGYLTRRSFNANGSLTMAIESSAPVVSFTLAAYVPASAGADDHVITYAYDRLERKIAETRHAVELSPSANGGRVVENLTTAYGYDALGRQTKVIDAAGNATYAYYDALGRVRATTGAWVMGDAGATTPLTTFEHDAHGNTVMTVQRAAGVVDATETSYVAGPTSAADRTSFTAYDKLGRVKHTVNAAGGEEFFSHDAAGRVAKSWQGVTGNDGISRTLFQVNTYDKVGQLVKTTTPASTARFDGWQSIVDLSQVVAGDVKEVIQYNAFGELVRRDTVGGQYEYFHYDTAGRVWRTNSGDGADRIQLHDVQGNVTAEIRSAGAQWGDHDITALGSAESADVTASLRRTDTRYDALGRATSQVQAARMEHQGSASSQRQYATGIPSYAAPGQNQVVLTWDSLAHLGTGDLKVMVEFRTPRVPMSGAGDTSGTVPPQYMGGDIRQHTSAIISGDTNASGTTLTWDPTAEQFGVAAVTRIVVYKKNVLGEWAIALDQAPGPGSNVIDVVMPANFKAQALLQTRAYGSSDAWTTQELVNFGHRGRMNASALPPGNYEYQVYLATPGEAPRAVATGVLTLAQPSLNPIPATLSFTAAGAGVLAWAAPAADVGQVLRYRPNGSTGAWSSLAVTPQNGGAYSGVVTSGLLAGTYQFELLWSEGGQLTPTSHATGIFTVVAGIAAYQIPAVGVPAVSGLDITTGGFNGTLVPALTWNDPGVIVAQYRRQGETGTAWTALPIVREIVSNWGQTDEVSVQKALLHTMPVGTFDIELFVGSPPTAHATAFVTIHGSGGSGPAPFLSVTTPAYTPAVNVAAVEPVYHVSVTTVAGTPAISTTEGGQLWHTPLTLGGQRWVRPVVYQKFDRWGNLVEISDPRSMYWRTTYRYNTNNQMVRQALPIESGVLSDANPASFIFYGRMGRQVATQDANGNKNFQQFDGAGNLVEEFHADGGPVSHRYNVFGEKVQTRDANGYLIGFKFDRMGRMLSVDRGVAGVYSINGDGSRSAGVQRTLVESWTYDQLGRKLQHTNGNGEVTRYVYDLRGNLTETMQPMGQGTRRAYDAQGRKIAETDANVTSGNHAGGAIGASTWIYSFYGLLTGHKDLGGATYFYTYDRGRQLTVQTNSRGQALYFGYDAAGQTTGMYDATLDKRTLIMYDLGGRRVREMVTQGVTYQDNHLGYDARGNLTDVADARVHISMEYDNVGNRTRVQTAVGYQGVNDEQTSRSDRYFKYDAMNRQVVVDGIDAAGNIGVAQGHHITYDKNGNRVSDKYYGRRVAAVAGVWGVIGLHGEAGIQYGTSSPTYTDTIGEVLERYQYDKQNRLTNVARDGTNIDVRFYDAADRVVYSGPQWQLASEFVALINKDVAPGAMNGHEQRAYKYDANGRLLHQYVKHANGGAKADISFQAGWTLGVGNVVYDPKGYDVAGNSLGYVVRSNETGSLVRHETTTQAFEGYQPGTITATSNGQEGSTVHEYDKNGFLTGIKDTKQPANNRTFVNDAAGRALFVNQGGNVQRQVIVNGEVLGIYGVGPASNSTTSNPTFADLVDFDFGYSRISASYPAPSPGTFVIRAGDTLQSIAQGAYGDSSLWYRIAEANGLHSSTDLKVGQSLTIPNRVGTVSNNNSTFKPYDPSRIEGDKTPHLPMAKGDAGCGGAGQLLMVIVAVVVTILTAGAMSGFVGTFAQAMTAGAGVMSGAVTGIGGAAAAAAAGSALGTAGTLAVAAAAGSVASQVVGVATGAVDKFSWKNVALSAFGGAVSGSLMGATPFGGAASSVPNVMARAAIGSMASQGLGVVAGMQRSFSWRAVAASAVSAGMGQAVAGGVDGLVRSTSWSEVTKGLVVRSIAGFAGGAAAAAVGGNANGGLARVAADAFGNALGSSLADRAGSPAEPALTAGDFARMDGESYWGIPYETANAAGGLKLVGSYGLQLTSGAVAAMDEGLDEARGNQALTAMRDAEIDAMVAAAGERQASSRQRAVHAWSGGAGAGRGFVNPESINLYANVPEAAQTSLPAGWNMRDAHAAAVGLEYEVRRMNARSLRAWSGVTTTQRFNATAGIVDAVAGNPLGAAGFLVGKAAGAGNADAGALAVIGAAAGELLSLRAGLRSSKSTQVDNYVSGLYRKDTLTHTPAYLFEIEQTGRYNYRVVGGGTTIDIDGYRGTTILEAKHVGDVARSPYIPESGTPPYIREKILKEQQSEFQRLKAVISDPAVPFTRVDVLTNHNGAVPYFSALMKQYEVPGTVRVVPTHVPTSVKRQP